MSADRDARPADVVVVGAGPAGAATAIRLARAGVPVTLVDKARFPRDKCCGDGLTTGALRLLEDLGLDPGAVPSWQRVDDVVVRSPSGREVTFPMPRDSGSYAVVTRRADLDAALVDLARSAGAKVLDGHACTGVVEHDDRVEVEIADVGTLSAGWLVAADGMWSPVRKHLGLGSGGYLGEWHAFRQYFTDVGPRAATELFVWFEPDLLPGYAWSFPLPGGQANVGFGIQRGGKVERVQDMAAIWRELLDRPHIREVLGPDAQPDGARKAWPIPARLDGVPLTGTRTLFVGDAATATDPMTGEGIGQALLTGVLAAEAIGGGDRSPAEVTGAYRRSVERDLVPDHKLARFLVRATKHRKGVRAAVRIAGLTRWTRGNFARWLFEDYPRAVALTPGRWRRGLLSGPGAYRS